MSPTSIDVWEGLQPRLLESRLKPLPQKPVPQILLASAIAFLALITAGCGSAGTKDDATAATAVAADPMVVAAYGEALAALQGGDNSGAEAKFQALAAAYPGYSGPLVNLAVIRAGRDELEPAAALLQQAVAVCSGCAAPWTELGVIQRRQGRFADAEQSYLRALAADPGYANACFNLGVLYELYLRRPELALEQYGRFRELQAEDPAAADIDKWIADLTRRTKTVERSAQLEEAR